MMRFLYNFRPVQDYFSSYETGKSVTGGKGENPEKTNLHTHMQNLVCVTRDCKTDQLGSNLRRRVHCLGVGSCQSDIALIVSQAYTIVPTLIANTRIHMYSILRRHFTCPFTDLLYVNKRTAIHDSNIHVYTCNR